MDKDIILTLYQLPQSVFTLKELALKFSQVSYISLKNRLHYFVQTGKLHAVRRGVYAKPGYNVWELANKLYTPSYISLETVLRQEGMIFQVDDRVSAISYLAREITIDGHRLAYHQMKRAILTDPLGLVNQGSYWVASRERAFLDAVFLYKNYYFDNLRPLDWQQVAQLQPLYQSLALNRRIAKLYKSFRQQYA